MSNFIKLFNPSNYARKDNVLLLCERVSKSINLNDGGFSIRDDAGNELPHQIDIIDPNDRSLDTLIIGIVNNVPPGPEDYSHASSRLKIEKFSSDVYKTPSQELELEVKKNSNGNERGILFSNGRLKIFFNLVPEVDYEWQKWYAGSATSVILDSKEIMDIGDWLCHDKEKRCMQIDKIVIHSSPWEKEVEKDVYIYDKTYRIVNVNKNGPNRVSATVATEPFDYIYTDPISGIQSCLPVSLYRVISLDRYADHVSETLFIREADYSSEKNMRKIRLRFKARYFSYINIGHGVDTYYYSNVPDWFAIGNNKFPPYNGYGFATDVHNELFINPHPTFPDTKNAYKSYSWLTGEGKEINCIHHFSHGEPFKFDGKSGKYWYEKIYKPIKAEYVGEGG